MTQPTVDGLGPILDRLGSAFTLADVMIPKRDVRSVAPGDQAAANELVKAWRYSAIPTTTNGGEWYESVFEINGHGEKRLAAKERPVGVHDFLPELTPLSEAPELFRDRPWYLTLRRNRVSGMVTYWDLNA